MENNIVHSPVLAKESIESLMIRRNGTYVDCTFGSGGHSKEILSRLSSEGKLISFDCDIDSLSRCPKVLSDLENFLLINDNFSNLTYNLHNVNIYSVDGFLFDLGLSSEQLSSNRGFSYRNDEDFLDMRMNKSTATSAFDIINKLNEKDLADIFFFYGEERNSRRIAKSICSFRQKESINKVHQLVRIISSCYAKKKRLKHPAKKVFQSLRIAVNEELEKLQKAILEASELLSDNSSLVVISYHSLEDRIVKKTFKSLCNKKKEFSCSKKPVVPSDEEIKSNNRSRSAKMRVLLKVREI